MGFLIGMAFVPFAVVLTARRKEAFVFRWQPTRDTWVAVGTGILAFLLSTTLLLFNRWPVWGKIIHSVLIYVVCGFVIPWGYTIFVERSGLGGMGVTRRKIGLSLVLNVVAALLTSPVLIFNANWSTVTAQEFSLATFVLLVGTLYETFLYNGFIHLRLEKAFGVIPAILVTSAIYVAWHTGTQLVLEPDIPMAIVKLYFVGVMYQSVFSMTRNLLSVWPFFAAVGVMIDFTVNIEAVSVVSGSYPWATLTIVLMVIIGLVMNWLARRRSIQPAVKAA
jgi:membrane protease YdiL (CAAX protease family)